MESHRCKLRGRRVVWYSDSTTALAAVRKQGTQKLSQATWQVTKEVLDLAEHEKITILPKHVPGRLNCAADALSRPEEERSSWERALERIAREWGPMQEDPCGATRAPTSLMESLEWARGRALLLPGVQSIGEVLELVELCAAETEPAGHPSMWDRMAVLVTPLWRGSAWWPTVERVRTRYIHLGRLASEDTRQWQQRNGHAPEWTASLIPLQTPCGQRRQDKSTREYLKDSWSGRNCRGLVQDIERG